MKKVNSVEEYIESHEKWSAPVYTINDKNVIGLGAFKHHFGIWFFNGVFLKDESKLLVNEQKGETKALRQMRFTSIDNINKTAVLTYVKEAIENQKLGKEIKPNRSKKETIIPIELKQELTKDATFNSSFNNLTPYKQREYCEYIATAKREATKVSRLEKIKPMILQGFGLHDKYKNC